MKNILLFGAGKSTTCLIEYLLKHADTENWNLGVVDADLQLAKSKIANHPKARVISFDIYDDEERNKLICEADIVISMLPPALHRFVALDCIHCKKHLLTASYVDDDMRALAPEIKKNDLLFLCEMGLDPGIDHMGAMKIIHRIRAQGGTITSYKSHCGGLIPEKYDDNPWHYKISWNPVNIVNAGKPGAVYKENNEIVELDYYEVFEDLMSVTVPGMGNYSAYANRNSLSYMTGYNLEEAETFIRTTLRHPDYCIGWHAIILAGLTDDADETTIRNYQGKNMQSWFNGCLNYYTKSENLDDFLHRYIDKEYHQLVTNQFEYLGLLTGERIPDHARTSADILRHLMVTKLSMKKDDHDMVIMLHEIMYLNDQIPHVIKATLVTEGENNQRTAMAKTVGLPLGIAARLILNGKISARGLHIPTLPEIYEPVLDELEENGIVFRES
jgi:saccharopine dehydrogenase-like NADP-dependent oxidoreductase